MRVAGLILRLPGKGNSRSHGARPVHHIISMTSALSIHNSLSAGQVAPAVGGEPQGGAVAGQGGGGVGQSAPPRFGAFFRSFRF